MIFELEQQSQQREQELCSVLFVDDDETMVHLLKTIFDYQNQYHLFCLSDSCQVIEFLQQKKIDLILLDIEMPGINGIELCVQIKKDPRFSDIPIIFVTASQEEDVLVGAFEAGGVDYVTKPFKYSEILSRVKTHLALRQSEQQLRKHEQQLKHQLALRELMLTTLSHDLRGPLSSAADYLHILMTGSYPLIEMQVRMGILAEALQSTYHLLDQTLTWARNQQEDLSPQPVEIRIAPFLEDCLKPYRLKAMENEIQLQVEGPADAVIWLDPDMLRTLILNLVNNALKYTPPKGRITVRAEFAPDTFRLTVCDTGMGIKPEQLSALNNQTYISSTSGIAGEKGTGLGLRICMQLAKRYGGHIEITSTVGQGSQFVLVLPDEVVTVPK